MAKEICADCGKEKKPLDSYYTKLKKGGTVCEKCANIRRAEKKRKIEESVILTTTNNVDGYRVVEYIGIGSVEVVIGSGLISEFGAGIADILGGRATDFEKKLKKGKEASLLKLKYEASELGGNAVIGVDLDFTEFASNMIGVIANGTIVKIEKIV